MLHSKWNIINEQGGKILHMNVEILPNYRLAYMRRVGPYGPRNNEIMTRLKRWASANNLMSAAILFGIPQDNPQVTQPEKCRYDVGIVITEAYQLDDSIAEQTFSGGKYAIYLVEHTEETLQQAWSEIFPLLQKSGHQIDNKPIVERYSVEMLARGYFELCVPIL